MIKALHKFLTMPPLVLIGIFAISTFSLAAALIAEHIFGLKPCILCIYQRIPFILTAILAIMGLILHKKQGNAKISAFFVLFSGALYMINSIIAFYHTGVERHWWSSFLLGCKVDFSAAADPAAFLAQIQNTVAARCDEIPWADPILGLSIANYNVMMCFGLGIICITSALLITRKENEL
jgi:disulfide bond formation protein DsbB